MFSDEKSRRRLPPYVSYHTFQTFIEDLQPIPARFDRSFWGKRFSGTTRSQLTAALLFLGLINISGIPTNRLKLLADAKDIKKTDILKQTCMEGFDFLFNGSFDPQTATPAQLQQVFHNNFQISSSVSRNWRMRLKLRYRHLLQNNTVLIPVHPQKPRLRKLELKLFEIPLSLKM
jgi:hypothetical protein